MRSVMASLNALRKALFLAAACAVNLAVSPSGAAEADAPPWCAPELETLSDGACYIEAPTTEGAVTVAAADAQSAPDGTGDMAAGAPGPHGSLVIFLHSLVGVGTNWQWEQQRTMAQAAKAFDLDVLMPRGRLGIGPKRAGNVWAWPTSPAMQEQHETTLVDEWMGLKQTVELRRGGPFEKVFVFGFSNGAYYAASLAVRGRLPVQGYGVFAGGSGGKYMRLLAARTTERAPVFVGYGTKDPAHRDQKALVDLLADLRWRHRCRPARVGHTVTGGQLAAAFRFLQGS